MKTISQILEALPPNDGRRPFWIELSRCIATGEYRRAFGMVLQNQVDVDFEEQIQAVCLEVLLKPADDNRAKFKMFHLALYNFYLKHYPDNGEREEIGPRLRSVGLVTRGR